MRRAPTCRIFFYNSITKAAYNNGLVSTSFDGAAMIRLFYTAVAALMLSMSIEQALAII